MSTVDMSALHASDFCEGYFYVTRMRERIPLAKSVCKKGEKQYCRLFYIMGGEFSITPTGANKIVARKGDILYLPTDVSYIAKWKGDDRAYCAINFVLNDTNGEQILFSREICHLKQDKNEMYLQRFEEIADIWEKGAIGYKMRARSRFLSMLYYMMQDNIKTRYKSIAEGIMYIENNYLKDTSVAELAAMCHVSESGFRKLFKEYSDHSPVQYRNILRIQKAQELLKSGEYTVSTAAEAVGITDVYYFSKMFKKVTGKSPKCFKS